MKQLMPLAAIFLFAGTLVPSALAQGNGKGKADNSVGFTLANMTDASRNEVPAWGDHVTFAISTTETTEPRVQVICFQNGDVVYGALWQPMASDLTLSSRAWQGGPADCSANLYYIGNNNRIVNLASLHFTVAE
jgi:hypothetical protein